MSDSIPAAKPPLGAAVYLGISKTRLYWLINNDPDFPCPIRFTKRCVLFPTASLDEYLRVKQAQEAAL